MKAMGLADEVRLRDELAEDLGGSFQRLVLAYQDRLYAFAYRVTGSRLDAEEIVQDAFVRAYRALRGYPEERVRELDLKPWLYRITLNLCRNRLRGRRVATVSLDQETDDGALDLPEDQGLRPDSIFEREERRGELARLVAALPERYREAVLLRYMEGISYAELASLLGQPVGTAKSNVHRGIELLRSAMVARESVGRAGVEGRR